MDRGEVNNWVRYVVWVDGNEFENEGVDISTDFFKFKGMWCGYNYCNNI